MKKMALVACCLFAAGLARGAYNDPFADATAVFYVAAEGGDDSAAGDAEHPLATIYAAVNKAADATPTRILLLEGTHHLSDDPVYSGQALRLDAARKKYISLEGEPGDARKVTIYSDNRNRIMSDGDIPFALRGVTLTHFNRAMLFKCGLVTRCIFTGNFGNGGSDNDVVFMGRAAQLENCLFYNNTCSYQVNVAQESGTAEMHPTVLNCTFDTRVQGSLCGVRVVWNNARIVNCVEFGSGVGESDNSACFVNCAGDFDRSGATDWTKLLEAPYALDDSGAYVLSAFSDLAGIGNETLYGEYAFSQTDVYGAARIAHSVGLSLGAVQVSIPAISATVVNYHRHYDGVSHACSLKDVLPKTGVTIKWSDGAESEAFDLDEPPAYTEIGTHVCRVKLSADGFEDYILTGTVEIIGFDKEFYVDAVKGDDNAAGDASHPLATIAKAVSLAAEDGATRIWLADGLHRIAEELRFDNPDQQVVIEGLSHDSTKVTVLPSIGYLNRLIYVERNVDFALKFVTLSSNFSLVRQDRLVLMKSGMLGNVIVTQCDSWRRPSLSGADPIAITGNACVENCLFHNNRKTFSDVAEHGQLYCFLDAGMEANTEYPVVLNCTFVDTQDQQIGGLCVDHLGAVIVNCVEWTGGFRCAHGASMIVNSAGDFALASDGKTTVDGWIELTDDPFENSTNGDFLPTEVLAGKGSVSLWQGYRTTAADLAGISRPTEDGKVSIGAYEMNEEFIRAQLLSYSGPVDGESHACSLNISYPSAGCTIRWREGDTGDFTLTKAPSYANLGIYSVAVKISAPGFSDLILSGRVALGVEQNGIYVFAELGNDGTEGTFDYPLKTLDAAVALAKSSKMTDIFLFDGEYTLVNPDIVDMRLQSVLGDPTKVVIRSGFTANGRFFSLFDKTGYVRGVTFTGHSGRVGLLKDGRMENCIVRGVSSNSDLIFLTKDGVVDNCLFYGNTSPNGVVKINADGNTDGSPQIVNCTFVGGTGVNMEWANGSAINCVEWSLTSVNSNNDRFFNCAGDFARENAPNWLTLTADPFVGSANNNYSIAKKSALAFAGNAARYPAWASATDLLGNPRQVEGRLSIGAYEVRLSKLGLMILVK